MLIYEYYEGNLELQIISSTYTWKKIDFDFILKFTHVTSAIPYSFDVCIEPITITYTFLSPSVLFLQLNFKSKRHKGTDNEIDFIPYSSFWG